MDNKEKQLQIINNIRLAIELAGDGGPSSFESEEYEDMTKFLTEIEDVIKSKRPVTYSSPFESNCFIRRYSVDLLNELQDLGYSVDKSFDEVTDKDGYFMMCKDGVVYLVKQYKDDIVGVDCRNNEKLFLALAALRSDNDYKQWFVHEQHHHWVNQGLYIEPGDLYQVYTEFDQCKEFASHKASVFEIMNHPFFNEDINNNPHL